jgi:hypothetical protein
MSERRGGASNEPVYSEADVADFRKSWEQAQKERETSAVIQRLQGQLDQLPALARAAVREVLTEERESSDARRRADVRVVLGYLAGLMVLVVPVEDLLISHFVSGHP